MSALLTAAIQIVGPRVNTPPLEVFLSSISIDDAPSVADKEDEVSDPITEPTKAGGVLSLPPRLELAPGAPFVDPGISGGRLFSFVASFGGAGTPLFTGRAFLAKSSIVVNISPVFESFNIYITAPEP